METKYIVTSVMNNGRVEEVAKVDTREEALALADELTTKKEDFLLFGNVYEVYKEEVKEGNTYRTFIKSIARPRTVQEIETIIGDLIAVTIGGEWYDVHGDFPSGAYDKKIQEPVLQLKDEYMEYGEYKFVKISELANRKDVIFMKKVIC